MIPERLMEGVGLYEFSEAVAPFWPHGGTEELAEILYDSGLDYPEEGRGAYSIPCAVADYLEQDGERLELPPLERVYLPKTNEVINPKIFMILIRKHLQGDPDERGSLIREEFFESRKGRIVRQVLPRHGAGAFDLFCAAQTSLAESLGPNYKPPSLDRVFQEGSREILDARSFVFLISPYWGDPERLGELITRKRRDRKTGETLVTHAIPKCGCGSRSVRNAIKAFKEGQKPKVNQAGRKKGDNGNGEARSGSCQGMVAKGVSHSTLAGGR